MNILMAKQRILNPLMAFVLIAAVACVIYSNIYNSDFVYDSVRKIAENKGIRDLDRYLSVDRILTPRAIVNFTFALNYRFGKLNVFGYHLVNVLIHIVNGCLVYLLAMTIFKLPNAFSPDPTKEFSGHPDPSIGLMALFSSLIFVAHPVQTQAVTYTVQRYTSMAALFYLASLLFYLRARIVATGLSACCAPQGSGGVRGNVAEERMSKRSLIFYGASLLCGMLAFLSKQNAATLPVALLLAEYVFIDRTSRRWRTKILWFGIFFVLWAIFVLYISGMFREGAETRGWIEGISGVMKETESVSRWRYLCTQFNVLVIYIKLLFLPVKQNLDHFYSFKTGFFDGATPLAFMFHVTLAGYGIWAIKRRPVVAFSIFFFFIALLVESSIIPIKDAMYEHRLYLPMFAFGLSVAVLLFTFVRDRKALTLVLPVLVIASLGSSAYMRNRVWQNNITLWSDVVSKSPRNFRGHINLGAALYGKGRPDEAIAHYLEALRIKPGNTEALNNLAVALSGIGHREEAERYFKELLETDSGDAFAHYNFGMHLYAQGNIEGAGAHFLRAVELKPDYAEAYNILGIVKVKQGDYRQAEMFFSQALNIKPGYDDPRKNLDALKHAARKSAQQAND